MDSWESESVHATVFRPHVEMNSRLWLTYTETNRAKCTNSEGTEGQEEHLMKVMSSCSSLLQLCEFQQRKVRIYRLPRGAAP